MTTLILTLFFACGDKEGETDSATDVAEESTEDTAVSEEE